MCAYSLDHITPNSLELYRSTPTSEEIEVNVQMLQSFDMRYLSISYIFFTAFQFVKELLS
jgi:hypothetical protein